MKKINFALTREFCVPSNFKFVTPPLRVDIHRTRVIIPSVCKQARMDSRVAPTFQDGRQKKLKSVVEVTVSHRKLSLKCYIKANYLSIAFPLILDKTNNINP